MEGMTEVISHGTSMTLIREEEDDDFRSCCEDEEVWRETDEPLLIKEESTEDLLDEFSAKMLFKGLSINGVGDSGSCVSGIGVFIERPSAFPLIKVQKKLDFYVEEPVADCLALMDGLTECLQNNIRCVYAFTNSELLYHQITHDNEEETPLLEALKERILEHSSKLEAFVLKCVPSADVDAPSKLAQVAMGVISFTPKEGDSSVESCSICCEDKPCLMIITLKCSHKFCSGCMRSYADKKVQSSQVPIRCPQETCKYFISSAECKSFLTSTSHDSFEKALREAPVSYSNRIYCPFPSCSVLIDPLECLSVRASSSSGFENNSCIECPDCGGSVCVDCGVPWHSAMSCEEYQSVPLEEKDSSDIMLSYRLPQNKRWRRCQQCRTMIELTHGCYHMTCRCGQEFCYSCGQEYNEGQQSCECAFWDEDNSVTQSLQESEQWAWETFNSLPMTMDAYSDQEKSQLALIQRFLAGGFSLSDHHPFQSDNPPRCTDSYVDAMKDLHQLPWLERFVSVISDTYYDDYIQ